MRILFLCCLLQSALAAQWPALPMPKADPTGSSPTVSGPEVPTAEAPATDQEAEAGEDRLDVITMKSGETLEGRISILTDGYVEIELDDRTTVGFSRAGVESIGRKVGRISQTVEMPDETHFTARERDYLLHTGAGYPVGWLRESVRVVTDTNPFRNSGTRGVATDASAGAGTPTIRVSEEWGFREGRERVAVTLEETASLNGEPLGFYYRERRTIEGSQEIRDERILEGSVMQTVDGVRELRLVRWSDDGRVQQTMPFPEGASLPLIVREQQRLRSNGKPATEERHITVFDPRTEELASRNYRPNVKRRVVIEGREVDVLEIIEAGVGTSARHVEWVDASSRGVVLHRRLGGNALVAVPVDRGEAQAYRRGDLPSFPTTLVTDTGRSFGFWLPNPLWQAPATEADELAMAQSALHGGRFVVQVIPDLDRGTHVEAAADTAWRKFLLLDPGFELAARIPTTVRGRDAVRVEAVKPRIMKKGRLIEPARRMVMHVVPRVGPVPVAPNGDVATEAGNASAAFLVATATAPVAEFDSLAADFARLLESLECDPAGLNPRFQGPLSSAKTR